jgi:L-asparagine transporter-like permease
VYASLIFFVAVAGGFQQLAILATAAILLIYLAVVLSTIKLRYAKNMQMEKTFRMPGRMLFPVIAIATICWLLSHLKKAEILSAIIFIVIVSMIYFVSKKLKQPLLRDDDLINDDSKVVNPFPQA